MSARVSTATHCFARDACYGSVDRGCACSCATCAGRVTGPGRPRSTAAAVLDELDAIDNDAGDDAAEEGA